MTTAELAIAISAKDRASGALRKLGQNVKTVGKQVDSMNKSASRLGTVTLAGAGGLGTLALKVGVNFNILKENATLAFTTLLKDGAKATAMIHQIEETAKKTPFGFEDLTRAAQRMLAFGFAGEDVIPILTNVSDAVSAMGGGADMIDRVTLAMGQMQAKGKVSGEEMLQLAEAGIPAWQILAENVEMISPKMAEAVKAGKLTQQQVVQRLMKMGETGKLKAGPAIAALRKGMTQRFGGLGEKQAKTTAGAASNLTDALHQLFGALTEGPLKTITGWMITLSEEVPKITEAFKNLAEPVKIVIGWIAGAVAVIAGSAGFLAVVGWLTGGLGVGGLLGAFKGLGAFLAGAASPFAILAAALLIAKLAWDRNFQPILDAVATYLTTFPHVKIALSWLNEQAKAVADWIMGAPAALAKTLTIGVAWASKAAEDIVAWLGAAGKTVKQTVEVAVKWASQAAADLVAWVKGTAVAVIQTVRVAYEWLSQTAYELATWVAGKIGDFAQTVSVAWEWLNTTAYDLATWVAGKLGDFAQTVKVGWEWASQTAYDVATWVAGQVGTFIQTIQTAWEFASANAGIVAAWVFDQIGTFTQTIQTAWEWASEHARTLANWVGGKIGVFGTTLKIDFQWVSDAARKIYEWWTGAGAKVGAPVLVGGGGGGPAHMAAGGIVTSPTLAMIGEAGPEAVVPLGRGGGFGGGGSVTYQFNNYGVLAGHDAEDWVRRMVDRSRQRGGVG